MQVRSDQSGTSRVPPTEPLTPSNPTRALSDDASEARPQRAAEVQALSERKRQLQTRLSVIEQGTSLVRAARRLGLVKPGEHLFIVQGIQAWRRANQRR